MGDSALVRVELVEYQPKKEKMMSTETKQAVAETKQPETGTTAYLPPEIDMIPVESSMLSGIGHDGDHTLRVWFKKGVPYDYPGISEEEFFGLVNAESPGKAYNALVKEKEIKGIKLAA